MEYKKELINNLKSYRKENNLTQEDFAEILGYSQKNIAKWEQGISVPPIEVLIELSSLMEMSIDKLLGIKKSILEKCVDHIITMQKLDENLRDAIFSKIIYIWYSVVDSFTLAISFKNCLQGYDNEIEMLAINYLKDNGHIIIEKEKWKLSDAFIRECFERYEELYNKAIITDKKIINGIESRSRDRELTILENDSLMTAKSVFASNIKSLEEAKKAKDKYFAKE
jgi:transcriptional regulator with XRE-family HTH domain